MLPTFDAIVNAINTASSATSLRSVRRLGERKCRFEDTLEIAAEARRRVERGTGKVAFSISGSSWYRRHRGAEEARNAEPTALREMDRSDVRKRLEELRLSRAKKRNISTF